MSAFIDWLDGLAAKDTKVRAVLRRSLAFEPGAHVPAFPYVEPFLQGPDWPWKRKVHYLTAGLWALHGHSPAGVSLGRATAQHLLVSGSSSTEARFIAVLDADEDQLPHRLRQLVALVQEQPLDFGSLLDGLLHWNSDARRTQSAWARDFYQTIHAARHLSTPTTPTEEP